MKQKKNLNFVFSFDENPVTGSVRLGPIDDFVWVSDLFIGATGAVFIEDTRDHGFQVLSVRITATFITDAFDVFADKFLILQNAVDVDAFQW